MGIPGSSPLPSSSTLQEYPVSLSQQVVAPSFRFPSDLDISPIDPGEVYAARSQIMRTVLMCIVSSEISFRPEDFVSSFDGPLFDELQSQGRHKSFLHS